MIPVKGYKNCFVGVLGLGLTGLATARALKSGGAFPLSWDDDPSVRSRAENSGIETTDLRLEANLKKVSILIISPGIPHLYPEPHPIVLKALKKGIVIDNDISLFFRSFALECWSQFQVTPKVICITGSNGKSTTTALLEHILSENNYLVESGGNIGKAALSLEPGREGEIKILEISSYQAELARSLQPDLAIFLNFAQDHSERHAGKGGYFASKSRLFTMGGPDRCIIGIDEIEGLFLSNVIREHLLSAEPVILFSVQSILKGSNWTVFYNKGFLVEWRNGRQVASVDLREKSNLSGRHNYQNVFAAYACCRSLGVSPKKIGTSLDTFKGLPHRSQVLGRKKGVLFVNDSKATNSASAVLSLENFKNIHWIVGGKEKHPGIESLIPVNQNVKGIYLIGSSEESFSAKLGDIDHVKCQNLETAFNAALKKSETGDTILLAPACSSFDQFRSFEERGDKFIELFNKM